MSYAMRLAANGVVFAGALALLALGGCTSTHTAQLARGTGTVQVFGVSYDKVWGVLPEGLADFGATVVETNAPRGYVVATREVTSRTYGERIAVFLERVDASHTRVEVVSRDYLTATQVLSNSVEDEIMEILYERAHR